MDSRNRFTDEQWNALAAGPAAAATAMMATSRPGVVGVAREMYAGLKAIKDEAPTGEAEELVAALAAYAEDHKDLAEGVSGDSDDREAMRSAALQAVDQAGLAAAELTPGELDGYVAWLVGIARSMAEAASDKGEEAAVSDAEELTIAEIERRLRRG
jgi:hypothetical protein